VASLALDVVENFVDAGRMLATLRETADRRSAVPAWLEPAIAEYEANVLSVDAPMLAAMQMLGLRA
jgi:hypothetical protein